MIGDRRLRWSHSEWPSSIALVAIVHLPRWGERGKTGSKARRVVWLKPFLLLPEGGRGFIIVEVFGHRTLFCR